MDCIVKQGSEKRDLKPITCGQEKQFRTIWREEGLEDIFPTEQVKVEEERRRQARKARENEARQEEGDGQDEQEEEEVRTQEEEEDVWQMEQQSIRKTRSYICWSSIT